MISVSLNELLNARNALTTLANTELPAKLSYRVAKMLKKVEGEYEAYDTARLSALQTYAIKDEDGNFVPDKEGGQAATFEPDKRILFEQDIQTLLSTMVEINEQPIPLELLEKVELTPAHMVQLEAFLSE